MTGRVRQNASSRARRSAPLKLEGELNIYTAGDLQQRFLALLNGGKAIDIDLAAVTEIDSAGLQQLLVLKRECEGLGRTLRVLAMSDAVREVFSLLNLETHFATTASAG